jgi:DNA-binding NtrC family response regulator
VHGSVLPERRILKPRILIADDDADMRALIDEALKPLDYDVVCSASGEEALALVQKSEFDVLVSDHQMSEMSGIELCRKARAVRANLAVILLTGYGSLEVATEALRAGAYDFVTKPVSLQVLVITIERAVKRQSLRRQLSRLNDAASVSAAGVIGVDGTMRGVFEMVRRVAKSDATALIHGETGTGKELVARALHAESGRKGLFVAVNCAAMPEGLLESELFGHMAGAFTDARSTRTGLFVDADGGTLFLDEIGEMGLGMQAKLLRALQERTVRPLGGSREIPFDTRVLAATNRDLEAEVALKRFREDLFYRINVITIEVPPLRLRLEDILPLAHHFIARAAKRNGRPPPRIGQAVAERLMDYDWPGNVRQLENSMERAVALARFDELVLDDLPSQLQRALPIDATNGSESEDDLPMEIVEERYIQKVLDAVGGNKAAAAKILGFDRRTLHRKLAHLATDRPPPVADLEASDADAGPDEDSA